MVAPLFLAFWYSGLFLFSLLGLLWLGHLRAVQRHERAVAAANELIIKHIRRRARRGY